jgi:hypothetical protein
MYTEDLIREIVSKMCPCHGKHPTVEIHQTFQVSISACCEEFNDFIQKIMKKADLFFDEAGPPANFLKAR